MKKKPTVSYTLKTLPKGPPKTDFARLSQMTDEDIDAAILLDEDAAPLMDKTFLQKAIPVGAKGSPFASSHMHVITLDSDIEACIEALKTTLKTPDVSTTIQQVLRQYFHLA